MWNYVFFKHYLVSRPKNDLTGVENYIFDLIKTESVDWIPIKTFLLFWQLIKFVLIIFRNILTNDEENDEDQKKNILEMIGNDVN